jgi:hypothetical protein
MNTCQDSRSLLRDLNPGPPEYEVGVLTTRRLNVLLQQVSEFALEVSIVPRQEAGQTTVPFGCGEEIQVEPEVTK